MGRTTAPAARDDHDHDEHDHDEHDHAHAFAWPEALRILFVARAAAAVWFQLWEPWTRVSVIGVAGVLVGGWQK